jgi:hypothetical protein
VRGYGYGVWFIKKFSKKQLEVLSQPEKYLGMAEKKTEEICEKWGKEFGI